MTRLPPEQGWSLPRNNVIIFDDTGELWPDGQLWCFMAVDSALSDQGSQGERAHSRRSWCAMRAEAAHGGLMTLGRLQAPASAGTVLCRHERSAR